MSIYVKTTHGAANLNPSRVRIMQLNYSNDTLERADADSKVINSKTIVIETIPTGNTSIYTNLPEHGEFWIDTANSFVRNKTYRDASYPIPYVNPRNWDSSICCHLEKQGQNLLVTTGNDNWTGYELVITIKYIEKKAFV